MRIFAASDLHMDFAENRRLLQQISPCFLRPQPGGVIML
jgi:hypothetical protein